MHSFIIYSVIVHYIAYNLSIIDEIKVFIDGSGHRGGDSMKTGRSYILPFLLLFLTGCSGTNPTSTIPNQPPSTQPISNQPVSGQKPISVPTTLPAVTAVAAYPNLSFEQPVEYLHGGDSSNRVFAIERTGKIFVFDNNPQVAKTALFLDLSNLIDASYIEKGLLGLAFHPKYSENGLFYVNYTNRTHTIVARYRVNPANPEQALPDSGQVLLAIAQPYRNHNGGHLAFGPDGYLYIGMGDGGSAGDPQGNAQNLGSLLGKMLRIDVNQALGGKSYGIPVDNPWFGNKTGYQEEIYAYGLRNPWKFSFDVQNGRLWVADVGQNKVEEIDIVEKGLNYGWNTMEGSQCYPTSINCSQDGLQRPVWEYTHPLGNSITGGYVYYGNQIPGLYGAYIYGDYVTGMIWALWIDADQVPHNFLLLDSKINISSFGLDQNNELYILDLGGKIYKLKEVV
jgi:glucose/arabinose dehydrogenase